MVAVQKRQLAGENVPEFAALVEEVKSTLAEMGAARREWQAEFGVTDDMIDALQRLRMPSWDNRLYWHDIANAPPTGWLDDLIAPTITALERYIDPAWLAEQARSPYQLDPRRPLELVGGVRVERRGHSPQRLAHMLLVAGDCLEGRPELDIFAAAQLVPELVALGSRLHLVDELGPEARIKLQALPRMPDTDVAATMHELLVGTALVRHGRKVEMLRPSKKSGVKTPDFRVHDVAHIPLVVECKRRTGLLAYEQAEADAALVLFDEAKRQLRDAGCYGVIAADFSVELKNVTITDWNAAIEAALDAKGSVLQPWGTITFEQRVWQMAVHHKRIYSPDFLNEVFGYNLEAGDWDGLVCQVDATDCLLELARAPVGLKWRSSSSTACLKKARGITSLFADATKQIPDAEAGIIYIAYPEGTSARHADARTDDTLTNLRQSAWYHRSGRQVPLVIVSRLLARPLNVGTPDLIESSQVLLNQAWDPTIITYMPRLVFTPGDTI